MMKFTATAVSLDAAAGDQPRTISGIAVPYNTAATVSSGATVKVLPGALPVDGPAPRLLAEHDMGQIVGMVTAREETDEGMLFTAEIARTRAGDDLVELLKMGAYDSVSIGIEAVDTEQEGKTTVVKSARWRELSIVAEPAFEAARITEIAASADADTPDETETPQPEKDIENMEEKTPEVVEAAAEVVPTAPIYAQPKKHFAMPSASEYLAAYHQGGEVFAKVNAAFIEAAKAKQTAIEAAAGDTVTTDTPGLLPVPIVAPVFADMNYVRPVVNAVGARAMPDGGNSKTFIRPTWTTHTSIAAQASELDAVSATTPVIASNVVQKSTLAGQVTLSVQDVEFTSPSALQIILQDLASQYLEKSDDVAADAIVAGASASGSTWTVTANDPTSLISALYDAARDILAATNFLPDHVFVSPDVWYSLGQQLDADKRPVFPYTGASGLMGVNGMGTGEVTSANTFNPFGLKLVADKNFAAGTMIVARGAAVEFYEQIRGITSVEVPSTLGRTFSYYGYVATFIGDDSQVKSIAIA
jgi:HK97 family phage prohead protease